MTASQVLTVYTNPASPEQFKQIAGFTLADGTPAVDTVCIFAGNYAASDPPYLRANNNNPPTTDPFDPPIQTVLDSDCVTYLQDKGLRVLLTITNGHAAVGWSQFTSEFEAQAFAEYLMTEVVDKYGLDGIDIDDEYSQGPPNDTSLIMASGVLRKLMPSKVLSKALYGDIQYFQQQWNGRTLAGNLDAGNEMSYGGDPASRLQPYTELPPANRLTPDRLGLGFWAEQPGEHDPATDAQWLKANGYRGVMVFGFEETANQDLAGELVNGWYGPGNWNPPAP